MRYQQPIYNQNNHSGLRNTTHRNVYTSSDMCVFLEPVFNLNGASKIDCTATTSGASYVITTENVIPVTFDFTGNTDSFTATTASFKYLVYKFNNTTNTFGGLPLIKSESFDYPSFSGTNTIYQELNVGDLDLDGEYLVKGYYSFDVCTKFLKALGTKVDTMSYNYGSEYNLYRPNADYYFAAMKSAETPLFLNDGSSNTPGGNLNQYVILAENLNPIIDNETGESRFRKGQNSFIIPSPANGSHIITLNGLVLALDEDYTIVDNIVTLNENIVEGDIITIIYDSAQISNIISENLFIDDPIPSGPTDSEGNNKYFLNTTTNKFEIYTSTTPNENNETIIVMINGSTLANGIDFYTSITNPKRIILEGNLLDNDIITIIYSPTAGLINGITTPNPVVLWELPTPPKNDNGFFTLEVSTTALFDNLYFSGTTEYIPFNQYYSIGFTASGTTGTQLFYRVKNEKYYTTICGQIITSTAYSETVPISIQSNSINSY
jgi:hypothetical protein